MGTTGATVLTGGAGMTLGGVGRTLGGAGVGTTTGFFFVTGGFGDGGFGDGGFVTGLSVVVRSDVVSRDVTVLLDCLLLFTAGFLEEEDPVPGVAVAATFPVVGVAFAADSAV